MKEKLILEKEIEFFQKYKEVIEKGYIPIVSSRNLLASTDYVSSLYNKRFRKGFLIFGLDGMKIIDCQKEFPEEFNKIMYCNYNGNINLGDDKILIYINNIKTNKTEFVVANQDGMVLESPLNKEGLFLKDVYNQLKDMPYDVKELRRFILSYCYNKDVMEETAKLTAFKIMCLDEYKTGLKRAKVFIKNLNDNYPKFYLENTFLNEFAIDIKNKTKVKKLKLFK